MHRRHRGRREGWWLLCPSRPSTKIVPRRTATPANLILACSGGLRISPRANPLDIALVSRSTSPSRNEFATSVARNAARTSPPQILIAFVHLRLQIRRRASASVDSSFGVNRGLHCMGTKREQQVNGKLACGVEG